MNGPEKGPNYGESRTKTPKLGNTDGENGSTYYGINSLDENMDSDTFTFCSRNFRQKLSWMQIQLCALKNRTIFRLKNQMNKQGESKTRLFTSTLI